MTNAKYAKTNCLNIPSPHFQFPTKNGVREICGDQILIKQCFLVKVKERKLSGTPTSRRIRPLWLGGRELRWTSLAVHYNTTWGRPCPDCPNWNLASTLVMGLQTHHLSEEQFWCLCLLASNMTGIPPNIIVYKLNVDPHYQLIW